MIDQTKSEGRKIETLTQFIMLRVLGRVGSWAEGNPPLWKFSRHWSHCPEHREAVVAACRDLERLGLAVSTPRSCCEVHQGLPLFTLSELGRAELIRISLGQREQMLFQWMHPTEILALSRASAGISARDPCKVVRHILDQARFESALGLGCLEERFVKLVKSACKVAAGRSEQNWRELEGALRSSTNVPPELADSIASILTQQPQFNAVPYRPPEPTEQNQAMS